jgi:hypothetical protein
MKYLFMLSIVLLALPATAQVTVIEGQVLTATWANFDCSHVCDQQAGAGVRVVVDGVVVQDLGIPVLPVSFAVTLPAPGSHTIALEAYNCLGGCSGSVPPPITPAAPSLTVATSEQTVRGPSAQFEVLPQ